MASKSCVKTLISPVRPGDAQLPPSYQESGLPMSSLWGCDAVRMGDWGASLSGALKHFEHSTEFVVFSSRGRRRTVKEAQAPRGPPATGLG